MTTNGEYTHQQATALFVGAFFDELMRWGVREVVISPGSRSTPLAMCAYELSRRRPNDLRIYVDIDERGAAFFALGMAKASGRPVALVCTSGTAVANYLPAVVEAATSRVPLIALTGDRPMRLQGLGAPQTCDQIKIFGDYVRAFRQMPEPAARACDIALVRQAAREAVFAADGPGAGVGLGPCTEGSCASTEQVASRGCAYAAGPVHLNFPFDEPLKPDFEVEGVFEVGRRGCCALPESGAALGQTPLVGGGAQLDARAMAALEGALREKRTLVLAGEGTCSTAAEAREVVAWANALKLPLLADPLSGLRGFPDACVIDNYDNVFRCEDAPLPEAVIRFGRYPVSKPATTCLASVADEVLNIVVDAAETRDWLVATDVLVACAPLDFVRQSWGDARCCEETAGRSKALFAAPPDQAAFFDEWVKRNDAERARILAGGEGESGKAEGEAAGALDECAIVRKLCELVPQGSLLFSANSMAIRALDTFLVKPRPEEGEKPVAVLCNRGQNGIDGTLSTALGAAQNFMQTTFLTGDFTLLHDLNALALQRELLVHHGAAAEEPDRSIVIVLLNNNGGAIFDMLPQASDDAYFERLFLVPQDVDFEHAAAAFGIPYARAASVVEFERAYEGFLGMPGISIIEAGVPLRGVRQRYAPYQVPAEG